MERFIRTYLNGNDKTLKAITIEDLRFRRRVQISVEHEAYYSGRGFLAELKLKD